MVPSKNAQKRPAQAQYKSLLKFLELVAERAKGGSVRVYAGYTFYDERETYSSDNPSYIIGRIKKYYKTGTLSTDSTFADTDESLTVHSNYSSYVEVQKEYERILKKIRSRLKSENADKLLSEINVETTSNPPQGPAFILPNGKFIDAVKTAGTEDDEDAIHFVNADANAAIPILFLDLSGYTGSADISVITIRNLTFFKRNTCI